MFDISPVLIKPEATPNFKIRCSVFDIPSPYPSASEFMLRYNWPGTENAILEVRNVLGQVMLQQKVGITGSYTCGANWASGVYFVVLRNDQAQSAVLKMNKL